ncbi:MAG: DedA family protein [Spirochaetes bacterium]|nr:DedA family protein [Spirochaetota bacterium]
MNLEWAIMNFGYPAIVAGTFFEGEVILVLAGFAAHRGYLNLPLVIVCAFAGTLLGDQLYFYLGRNRGKAMLARHPGWEERISRFSRLMDRYHTLIILGFRFLYGLRTVAPFAIGMSEIPAWKFAVLNTVSAAVWAATVGVLGYLFGHTMEILLDEIKRYEMAVMAGLLALAVIIYAIKRYRNRIKSK